jgi:hypothetical protein
VQITECGPNGRFEFVAVRPGEDYGLALAGDLRKSAALLEDDNALKQATDISVRANESTSAEFRTVNR